METIDRNIQEAFAWLRFALDPVGEVPVVTDWEALLAFAQKQRIAGVCSPADFPFQIEKTILRQWGKIVMTIEKQNAKVNNYLGELCRLLEDAGFSYCILKGQGNAQMYPYPPKRAPGDIDVWIDADMETVYAFVRKLFPEAEASYKHIHFPLFKDVPVDVHVTPLRFHNPRYQRRLQQWIEREKAEQFSHRIAFADLGREICVPTLRFNMVYQLGHILIHLFDEGVGLRHVIDYYYLLKQLDAFPGLREEIRKDFKDLGLMRFASAVMWIEKDVLGLPEKYCPVETHERLGRVLLADMLEGGNFGKFSTRYHGRKGFYRKGLIKVKRNMALFSFFPSEAGSRMVYRMRTAIEHAWEKNLGHLSRKN